MKKLIRMLLWYGVLFSLVVSMIKVKTGLPSKYDHISQIDIDNQGEIFVTFSDSKKDYMAYLDKALSVKHLYTSDKKTKEGYSYIDSIAGSNGGVYELVTTEKIGAKDNQVGIEFSQKIKHVNFKRGLQGKVDFALKLNEEYEYTALQIDEDKDGNRYLKIVGYCPWDIGKIKEEIYAISNANQLSLKEEKDYTAFTEEDVYKFFFYKDRIGYISKTGELYLSESNGQFKRCSISGLDVNKQGLYKIIEAEQDTYFAVEQKTGNIRQIDFDENKSEMLFLGEEYVGKGTGIQYQDLYEMEIDKSKCMIGATYVNGEEMLICVSDQESQQRTDLSITFEKIVICAIRYFVYIYMLYCVIIAAIIGLYSFIKNCKYLWAKLFLIIGLMLIALIVGAGHLMKDNYQLVVENDMKRALEEDYRWYSEMAAQIDLSQDDDIGTKYQDIEQSIESYDGDTKNKLIYGIGKEAINATNNRVLPKGYRMQYGSGYRESRYVEEAYKKEKLIICSSYDNEGKELVLYGPLKSKDDRLIGVIVLQQSQIIGDYYSDEMKLQANLGILIVCISSIIILFIILQILFRPIYEVEKNLKYIEEKNTTEQIKYYSKDELYRISKMINTLLQKLEVQKYSLENINNSYFKFVPKFIFNLLDKKNLADLHLGDYKKLDAAFGTIMLREIEEQDETIELNDLNKIFGLIEQGVKEHEGILLADNSELTQLSTLYLHGAQSAFETVENIYDKLHNEKLFYPTRSLAVLDYGEVELVLAGTEERLVPILKSERRKVLIAQGKVLKDTKCHMIFTEEFLNQIQDKERYQYRYIGYLKDAKIGEMRLYDCYSEDEETVKQLKDQNKDVFEMAIKCFYNNEFYKAKNIFSMIIRDNPKDEVARWYIFRCNELEKSNEEYKDLSLNPYSK